VNTLARSSVVAAFALLAAGCGGTRVVTVTVTTTVKPVVPPAPIALGVPAGYRAQHVWRARLSGGPIPEAIVTSIGPPATSYNFSFHSADLRILAWDPLARRWSVAFDAQKVAVPDDYKWDPGRSNADPGTLGRVSSDTARGPLLDRNAQVDIGPVRFGRLLPGRRSQLVFQARNFYGGSGIPMVLAAIDLQDGVANLVYTWSGEGLDEWHILRSKLEVRAAYWTPTNAHCCPLRDYRFTVAERDGSLGETFDDRPWLGIGVRELADWPQLRVTGFDDNSPARTKLLPDDVILGVRHVPKRRAGLSMSVFDQLSTLRAGDVAQLDVERGGARIVVSVRLGSMRNAVPSLLPATDLKDSAL
jgi:hypothetical protein